MTTNRASGADPSNLSVPVYILAGGQSRRYGRDKARAVQGGVPLLVGVARALEPISSRTTVVAAHKGAYDDLGFKTIGDVVPRMGPLGGLLTAIEDCGEDGWLFLCACDWVGIRAEWVRRLLQGVREGAQAVVYKAEHYEPLFALYHTSIRDMVSSRLDAGRLEVRGVFEGAETVEILPPEGLNEAKNLNRPPTG
jgi:molybdopterin-guanine dinucleotide biosynthesis protein A